MKRTRIGKIARLSLGLRNDINQMLQDGKSGKSIVQWVNSLDILDTDGLDEIVLKADIIEQNLSEWRAGGYQDWLKQQEALELVRRMTEEAGELGAAAEGEGVADRFAAYLTVEMTRVAKVLLEKETDPEKRWERLCAVSRELSRIRREDHRAVHTRLARERREREVAQAERAERAEEKQKFREQLKAAMWGRLKVGERASLLGGSAEARNLVAKTIELENDLPEGCLSNLPENRVTPERKGQGKAGRAGRTEKTGDKEEERADPSESDPIQPSPTKKSEDDK